MSRKMESLAKKERKAVNRGRKEGEKKLDDRKKEGRVDGRGEASS